MANHDVIIVGGGLGGLVAGSLLSAGGVRVLLFEQSVTLGGCAATFLHRGYRFDAGATIGTGFQSGGPLSWLADRLQVHWPTRPLPVAWEYRDGDRRVPLDPAGSQVLRAFPETGRFWRQQTLVADRLWKLGAELMELYGRLRVGQLASLAFRLFPRCLSVGVARLASMTAMGWLKAHRLAGNGPFRRFIDAQLLISAQTTSMDCNALFAALALDLPKRSPCAIAGGIGTIADILGRVIIDRGGDIRTGQRVRSLEVRGNRVQEVVTDSGRYRSREVIVNGSSALLARLLGQRPPVALAGDGREAWGAFILHLGVDHPVLAGLGADHLQLLQVGSPGLAEGRSLFFSTSPADDMSRAPEGKRAVSLSTHTAVEPWWQAWRQGPDSYRGLKDQYTARVLDVAERYIPGLRRGLDLCLAGTPVTYCRHTGRDLGLVGGYAQTRLVPPHRDHHGLINCALVGDGSFPGQSIAGVTVGAALVVDSLMRRL